MSIIHILSEAVANKIAAGEVVERPASVVKELLENSLDAGAGRVEITVEGGGKRLIRIVDDGQGMTHDDALLAFERHATSKIRSAEDLFEISTLGFRGEALPSIAAVSRLVLETKHASENSGTRIEIAGGKLRDVKEVAWPQGTSIEVRDIFYVTPARRKFLKSESTELGHIATLATHYALAHPEKNFRLASLTNEILNVSPVASHRERLYQVMGGQLIEQLLEMAPVERRVLTAASSEVGEESEPPGEAPLIRVQGFISRPEVQKLNRNNIYFFVNRRLVRDRLILHAITEAYRNILPSAVFPVVLIFLEIPPSEVDVNVHPSKTEVRFRHGSFVHDLVRDSIRQTLLTTRPVAAFPISRSAAPAGLAVEAADVADALAEEPPLMRGAMTPPPPARPSGRGTNREFHLSPARMEPRSQRLPLDTTLAPYAPVAPSGALSTVPEAMEVTAVQTPRELPMDLQPLGQVQDSFIVAVNNDGLWIVDQHAAHERVLFDRHVVRRREKKIEVQRLLMPIIVQLKPEQQVTYQTIADELAANGFEVEPFGQRTVAIKAAPADLPTEEVEKLMVEILEGASQDNANLSLDDLRGRIAASISCHAAIKVNMALDQSKMDWLLQALGSTDCPMTCPHGRPTVLRYGTKDLMKAFKRI
ncbi:MAG: DNA mismatch repair endonuclease MutL [Terriglobia bacterium]